MLVASGVVACSSFSEKMAPIDATPSEVDAGEPATDAASEADALIPDRQNPYGAAYPTKHLGTKPRTDGGPGDVIANLKLTGYAPGATASSVLQMADVYDPQGRTHDLVALIVVASWDPISPMMVEELRAAPPSRVALFPVLVFGAFREAAKKADLDAFRVAHLIGTAWYAFDPGGKQLPPLDESAVPGLILLDARTMEIVGVPAGWKKDEVKSDLEAKAAEVKARPPAY